MRGLNLGVDFVGGQMIQVTFDKVAEAPVGELRDDIDALNLGESTIQRFGQPNQVSVRMRLAGDNVDEVNAVTSRVTTDDHQGICRAGRAHRRRGFGVGQGFRASCLTTGVYSLVFAMIAIAIYIWFRFEWQFGVAALFALFHDVALTFGFFALTQLEFNLNIVAALLTIIGYSLNDTIVVFDRVRENLRKYRKMDMIALLDLSTNETLARTVMTIADDADRAGRAAGDRPGRDLRLHRRDDAGPVRRVVFVGLHGQPHPGVAGRRTAQLHRRSRPTPKRQRPS